MQTTTWRPRDAALDRSWLSRQFETNPKLAPRFLITALMMAVGLSFAFGYWWPQEPLRISTSGIIATAGLFIGALAIERLTELLIAPWVGDVAGKASRTVLIGSAAAVLAAVVAGSLGLYLLEILTDEAIHTSPDGVKPRVDKPFVRSIDILVTAMAIAGGTKPLHDLLSSLEKRTEKAKQNVSDEAADTADLSVDVGPAGGKGSQTTVPYRLEVTLTGSEESEVPQSRIDAATLDIGRIVPESQVTVQPTGKLVVAGELPFGAGSKSYTKTVFEFAYRLAAAGYEAEPDLAAPASLTVATESTDPRPESADRDWAIKQMNVTAEQLAEAGNGKGVVIGHPDTGYRLYDSKPDWDLDKDYDFVDDDADAADSLITRVNVFEPDFVPSRGHGTSTASILGGQRSDDPDWEMYSMAPEAKIIPYRVMHGPVHLFDSDVAQAVRKAVDDDCKVISMSLGGYGFSGLREAIQHAVDNGVIVLAAAGNQVGVTVSPADYPETIAVASSKANGFPFVEGSSQGPEVTITAPGTDVWRVGIKEDGSAFVGQSTGTSYAVAHVAGLAAVWYGKHRANLDGFDDKRKISRTFGYLLQETATQWKNEEHTYGFGPGIVNAQALLEAAFTGDDAPSDDDLDGAMPMDEPETAIVKITSIGANLFIGEGTIDFKTKIVTKLVDLFGVDRKDGERAAGADQGSREANVRELVIREADHHYRTDSEFRGTVDDPNSVPGVPAAATREFGELVGAFNASGGGASAMGDMSKALRRALAGKTSVRGRYRWVGFALLGVALVGSALLGLWGVDDPVSITATTTVVLTAFYVAAQALERIVEYTFGRVVFYNKPDRGTERALILLGITIALGCLLAGATGFRLLEALGGSDGTGDDVSSYSRTVSIFVTGLAIGGGTKPIHDLLTRIQASSKAA